MYIHAFGSFENKESKTNNIFGNLKYVKNEYIALKIDDKSKKQGMFFLLSNALRALGHLLVNR